MALEAIKALFGGLLGEVELRGGSLFPKYSAATQADVMHLTPDIQKA